MFLLVVVVVVAIKILFYSFQRFFTCNFLSVVQDIAILANSGYPMQVCNINIFLCTQLDDLFSEQLIYRNNPPDFFFFYTLYIYFFQRRF